MRKSAVKVFSRLAHRWGQPDYDKDATPESKAMMTLFNKTIAPEVVKTLLQQLADWRNGRFLTQRCLYYTL